MSEQLTSSKPDVWKKVFPFDEARRAAEFLFQTWQEMASSQPQFFDLSKRENYLTERLHYYIDNFSKSKGRLTGFWINENPQIKIDKKTGEIIERTRKDITYFSNSGKMRLVLIFEFKKLCNASKSIRAYVRQDGMQRFVDRRYGENEPIAAMVAMIVGDKEVCLNKLKNYITQEKITKELKIVPCLKGKLIRYPSAVFPSVANFDTEHKRTVNSESYFPNISIAHIFLTFFNP